MHGGHQGITLQDRVAISIKCPLFEYDPMGALPFLTSTPRSHQKALIRGSLRPHQSGPQGTTPVLSPREDPIVLGESSHAFRRLRRRGTQIEHLDVRPYHGSERTAG